MPISLPTYLPSHSFQVSECAWTVDPCRREARHECGESAAGRPSIWNERASGEPSVRFFGCREAEGEANKATDWLTDLPTMLRQQKITCVRAPPPPVLPNHSPTTHSPSNLLPLVEIKCSPLTRSANWLYRQANLKWELFFVMIFARGAEQLVSKISSEWFFSRGIILINTL